MTAAEFKQLPPAVQGAFFELWAAADLARQSMEANERAFGWSLLMRAYVLVEQPAKLAWTEDAATIERLLTWYSTFDA